MSLIFKAAVVLPNNTDDVSTIVKLLRQHNIDFVVSGGRHSTSGASSIEDGVVIDLRKMNNVTVNEDTKTLAVQGGCLWKDVDETAAKYGLATVGGELPAVFE
jgi:FAD/FMN-containing dehydrogenase